LITAIIAQKLAATINDELMLPGTVYTAGLLLNIGLLLAVHIFPSQVNDAFAKSDRINGSVAKLMHDNLGKTQYEIGGILLERWKLPVIFQTIVKQFRQSGYEGKEKKMLLLLELSHWAGAYVVNNKLDQTPDFYNLLDRLSLSNKLLENIVDEVSQNKDSIINLAKVITG
jgi:HD-like signal output (HDOD) protein